MSNGLGAGFGGLLLLAAVALLATVQSLLLAGAYAMRGRGGAVPTPVGYLSAAVLAGVLAVAGFAVLALFDEAPKLAALFVVLVFLPSLAAGWRLRGEWGRNVVVGLSAVGLSWSVPFLLGVGVVFGSIAVAAESGVSTTAPAQDAVLLVATLAGGAVATAGTLLFEGWVRESSFGG